MTNSEILWKAILANPRDWVAWAAYCDALREEGGPWSNAADEIQSGEVRYYSHNTFSGENRTIVLWGTVSTIAIWCKLDWWMKHGPDLMKTNPIMWVRITDKRPYKTPFSLKYLWYNYEDPKRDQAPEVMRLDPEIFDTLENYEQKVYYMPEDYLRWRSYNTTAKARYALNEACWHWARKVNGETR